MATPAAPSTILSDELPTLAPLQGVEPLKTVQTVLGQAVVYPKSVENVLPRTLEQLKTNGYTVKAQQEGGASLEKDGQALNLSVKEYFGVVVVDLARDLSAAAPAADMAAPAVDTTATPAAPDSAATDSAPTAPAATDNASDTAAPAVETPTTPAPTPPNH